MSQDPAYFTARATEERRLAMAASDPAVRRIHLDMAAEYARRARLGATPQDEPEPGEEQRSA